MGFKTSGGKERLNCQSELGSFDRSGVCIFFFSYGEKRGVRKGRVFGLPDNVITRQ